MADTVQTDGSEPQIQVGTVVLGRFRVERRLGHGAYGEVWQALDLRNGHVHVALKFLHSRHSSAEARRRFALECSALEVLMGHPNIVTLRERGEFEGQDFMVLELLEGKTLAQWLAEYQPERPPVLAEVLRLFAQVCRGVASAHRAKSVGPIIHRDIKPANVMLVAAQDSDENGVIAKLLDFGVARLGQSQHTLAGQAMGTPLYMSPEQSVGDEQVVSPRSDVFALGILLIEMLTLRPTGPDGRTLHSLSQRGMYADLRMYLRRCRPDVPRSIWNVVLKAVEHAPEHRYADAGELLQALGLPAPGIGPLLPAPNDSHPRRFFLVLVGSVCVVVMGVSGWWWCDRTLGTSWRPMPSEDFGQADSLASPKPVPPHMTIPMEPAPDLAVSPDPCGGGINNVSCNVITAAPGAVIHINGQVNVSAPLPRRHDKREAR